MSKLEYVSFTLTLRQPYAAEIAALRSQFFLPNFRALTTQIPLCMSLTRLRSGELFRDAAFLLTVGSFMLKVELFFLTVATFSFFAYNFLAFYLQFELFCLQWESASNKGLEGL